MASFKSEAQIVELLQNIQAEGNSLAKNDSGARQRLLSLSYALSSALETPSETIQRIGWTEPARFASTKIAIDLGIFDLLGNAGQDKASDGSLSVSDISDGTGTDAILLQRLLKHLAATHIIHEAGANKYAATPLSTALREPRYRDGITYTHDVAGPSFHHLPEYLQSIEYKEPNDITNGPFQYAHGTNHAFFAWIATHRNGTYAEKFANYMTGYRKGKPSWCDFFPVASRLGPASESDTGVVIVDVGGGLGHDLLEFAAKHSSLALQNDGTKALVLQDQADVIAQLRQQNPDAENVLSATVHDFFQQQPVKCARAYYLHSVLHDWDDASAVRILQQLAPAMAQRSKLLINDFIVGDRAAPWPVTSMDMLMMVLGAVRERTETDWRRLLDTAGFEILKIWNAEGGALAGTESLIEAVLKT